MFGLRGKWADTRVDKWLDKYQTAHAELDGAANATRKMVKEATKAERGAKQAIANLNAYNGGLGENMRSAWTRLGDVFRGSGHVTPQELVERASKTNTMVRAPFWERVVAKPFALVAKNPRTALALAAGGVLIAGRSMVRGNARRRTEAEAMQQMAAAQQPSSYQYAAAQQQPPISYMNSVGPEAAQEMDARMKGNGQPTAGHADTIAASRQQGAVAQL